jgi:hypothetical protein
MKLALFCTGLMLVSLPALANSQKPAQQHVGAPASISGATAISSAAAVASPRINLRASGGGGGAGGAATAQAGGATVVNNGGGYAGAAVPFSPPALATGNPCAAGISIGGFGIVGGGGGAAQWELHDCRLRIAAVLLDARGDRAAAKNVWCQISEVREAYDLTPEPCKTRNTQTSAPVSRLIPAPSVVVAGGG